MTKVRPGRISEINRLREIERSAGIVFAELGMQEIANAEPPEEAELASYCRKQQLWVATSAAGDMPIAYIMVDVVDGYAHIEQVSVAADYAGNKVGQALIHHVIEWAHVKALQGVSLTTFKTVPWNAPYYTKLGFDVVEESAWGPGLRAIRAHEAKIGLDQWPRVCMAMQFNRAR